MLTAMLASPLGICMALYIGSCLLNAAPATSEGSSAQSVCNETMACACFLASDTLLNPGHYGMGRTMWLVSHFEALAWTSTSDPLSLDITTCFVILKLCSQYAWQTFDKSAIPDMQEICHGHYSLNRESALYCSAGPAVIAFPCCLQRRPSLLYQSFLHACITKLALPFHAACLERQPALPHQPVVLIKGLVGSLLLAAVMRMQGLPLGTGLTLQQKKSKLWGSKAAPADASQVSLHMCVCVTFDCQQCAA